MKEMNFNNQEYRQKRVNRRVIKFFVSIFAIIVVIELIVAGILYINNQASNEELNRVDSKLKLMQDNINGIKKSGTNDPSIDQEVNALQLIIDKESSTKVSDILKQIGDATPQKVWYTSFEYNPSEITLSGKTIESSDSYVEDDLVTLEKKLSSNPIFSSVKVVREDIDSSRNLGGNYVRNFKVILILSNPFPLNPTTQSTQTPAPSATKSIVTQGGSNE